LCFYGFSRNRPRCVNTQECDVTADANTATSYENRTREPTAAKSWKHGALMTP